MDSPIVRVSPLSRRRRFPLLLCAIVAAGLGAGGCEPKQEQKAPPPMDVLVAPVAQRTVPVYREWIGTINGYINAQIRPQVKGYLLTRNYNEGDAVKNGQLLFQIDPREFQAQVDQAKAQIAQAEAMLGKTQLDVARYRPLAAEGAVSQQELDNAIQANLRNQASVDAAKAALVQAELNLGWTKVTSPIDGVSGIAVAQIGDLVGITTVLTTVSQLDPIKVVFPVSEQEYLKYARNRARTGEDQTREDQLELILADGTIYPERGTVSVVGREVDPRTGTITIEGLFKNPNNLLRPGGYAKIRAVIDELANAMVVPQAAIQETQGQTQVVVVNAENKVEIRNVTTGPKDGMDCALLDGVKPGDRVIVEGLQKVRAGMTVAPKPFVAPPPAPTPTQAPF